MSFIKALLNALNGRKRYIGLAAAFIYGGLVAVNVVPFNDTVVAIIAGWTGVAYTHAAYKGE